MPKLLIPAIKAPYAKPMASFNHPKNLARQLKRAFEDAGMRLKLSYAQQLVARMLGYSSWFDMSRVTLSERPWSLTPEQLREQIHVQQNLLAHICGDVNFAAEILSRLPFNRPRLRENSPAT